jgi:ABC-type antimicrobial peptide transport system permease subunit
MRQSPQPPRWAQALLGWYCKPELLEDLQGDLHEYFERNVQSKGVARARFIYIIDVLKFFRLYTIRKPHAVDLLIQWIMIGSYVKTSSRNIVRNKLFSAINIIGLSVSMSVGLLVIAFVNDLMSYDDFHTNKERIYRLNTLYEPIGQKPVSLASTSVKAGKKIEESFTQTDQLVWLRNGFGGDAQIGDKVIPTGGLWASEKFFHVFTFPLIQGNPATALKEPYSIVLTEKTATKLFGTTDALGKNIRFDTTSYLVTGVMKDVPKLSHLRFDLLISFSTAEILVAKADPNFLAWENVWSNYVYMLLPEHADLAAFQKNLDKLNSSENRKDSHAKFSISLQPMTSIALGKHLSNEIGPSMIPLVVWIMIGMAGVIILSACFNYTNLSIARSLKRSREVGVRKLMGAVKGQVMGQFITESVIISLLALAFSFLLFLFLRVQFIGLSDFIDNLLSLELTPRLVLWFLCMAVGVGMLAGFLPALFFSRINVLQAIKNLGSIKVFRHVTLRKGLIVVQYTLSLIFITTTVIGYRQYRSMLSFDLGFKTENIVNMRVLGNSPEALAKELSELPEVVDISHSLMVTSLGSMHGTQVKYKNSQDSAMVYLNKVDDHYLPIHEHKLVAGNNFTLKPKPGEESEVIVNEQVLKRFDISPRNPEKALGEELTVDNKKLTIVGVLKDFHYGTVENEISPVILLYTEREPGGYINLKVSSSDWAATLSSIESVWKKIDKVHPMQASFYNEQIEQAYRQFSVMVTVIGFVAFLAICIASMGMFGMVVFTTETRLREISIRKVLGANERALIYLLSKGFIILLVIAACIALPVTYVFFEQVVLRQFAYHDSMGVVDIFLGACIIGALALIMIGSQTIRTARSNPAEVLKAE